ncbi:MAG: hypothetical protein ACE15C_01845 [Phycisphaerae bacterium]
MPPETQASDAKTSPKAPKPLASRAPSPAVAKPRLSRNAKLIALGVVSVAAVLVYLVQTAMPPVIAQIFNYKSGLDQALVQARADNRKLFILFASSPPGQAERDMAAGTLSKEKNREAIKKGNFICLRVDMPNDLKGNEIAAKYRVEALPTWIILDPKGKELNRRVGFIGEVPFRNGFLDCSQVVRPAP